jgi:hypothetical protein
MNKEAGALNVVWLDRLTAGAANRNLEGVSSNIKFVFTFGVCLIMKIVYAVSLSRNMLPELLLPLWQKHLNKLEESFSLIRLTNSKQVWLRMWLQFLSSWQSQRRNIWPGKIWKTFINSFRSSSCALWRWFRILYIQQKSSRDWQWRDAKIIFNFLCYKITVCDMNIWTVR